VYYQQIARGDQHPKVREENECRLSQFVLELRQRLTYPVFDSGLLKIPDWSGRDHGIFFLEVIKRYARECWFLDGWEYSTGATKEFVFCRTIQTPCYRENGGLLTVPLGMQLIREAADFVRSLDLDDAKLRSRAADLSRLVG
jgi:hypothetical protein